MRKMVYSVYNKTPEKIIKYNFKNENKKVKVRLPIFKNIKKENVVGYLSGRISEDVDIYESDKSILNLQINDSIFYCEVEDKPKKCKRTAGYIQVEKNRYLAVQKNVFFLILMFLFGTSLCVGITGLLLSTGFFTSNEDIVFNPPVNNNVINLDDIPTDTSEIDVTQEMAYVSGQSITLVKESYPNVYLKNEAINVNYTLVYECYLNGSDTPCYTTGHIAAGTAEPWNAYACDELVAGNNSVLYEVYFYNLKGNMVGHTVISGLTIAKG